MVRPNLHDPGAVLGAVKAKLYERPWRAGLDRACARRMSRDASRDEGTAISANQGTDAMGSRR
jgi:hypothetical protein